MKCRAKTVRKDQQTLTVTRLYGVKTLEAIQSEAALLLLDAYPWFRRAGITAEGQSDRMKQFFDGQARYCSTELNDNAADKIRVKSRARGWHEADEDERFEEIASDADFRLTRRLSDAGIDADALWDRAEAYLPEREFYGDQAIHRDARVTWYAWLGRRAVRMWIAAACLSLLDFKLPSGRRRFSIASVEWDFAVPLADFAAGWLCRFFAGRDRTDQEEQEARLRRLREEYNIDLKPVDPDADNAANLTRIAKTVPETQQKPNPAGAPEKYAQILKEVQSGITFYVGGAR